MKANAVVFTNKLTVAYQEVDIPELGQNQVLIDVHSSWISIGTESSFLRKERIAGESPYREGDASPFPHVSGYQKVGIVREVGPGVTDLKAGDRVFATISEVSGMAFSYGGHVSPAVTNANQVWKLPEEGNPIAYSGLVLTQVGYNCGIRPPVIPGDLAVVIGDGLVGQWAAQTLLHRGARVVVLGRHEERLALLPKAVLAINTNERSFSQALSTENGINIIVDTVGSLDTFHDLKPFMKRDSHLVSAGFLGEKGTIDIQTLRAQEITLHCPSGWTKERMDATLMGIREGWLQTEPLISHRFPVERASEAWQAILSKREGCLGVVLDWS